MFNKFIKKSSKFFAVLLTATLAFTPLSYGATPTTFAELNTAILSDGTPNTITISDTITATESADTTLGEQGASVLTLESSDTDNKKIDGNSQASGMKIGDGQETTIDKITFENFYKEDGEGSVILNENGKVTISNSEFNNNISAGNAFGAGTGFGGAIGHDSDNDDPDTAGSLTITDSSFTGNKASAAGAIFATGPLSITDTSFKNNEAEYIGAVGQFGHENEVTALNNVSFEGNKATVGGAGAVSLGSAVDVRIDGGEFNSNQTATNGGAIGTEDFIDEGGFDPGSLTNAFLSIVGATFISNIAAGQGGAIDNYFYKSSNDNSTDAVYVNGVFEQNQAANGGAIYNHSAADGDGTVATMFIKDSEFTGNTATTNGGAIYNAGILKISGTTFEDNMVGTVKNDIYNDGEITILDGTTGMNGGIVGDGDLIISDGGELELVSGAKLEQMNLTVGTGSSLIMDYSDLTIKNADNKIVNNGLITFNFTGGELNLVIEGDGETKYDVDVQEGDTVEIEDGNTIDVDSLKGEGEVENNGTINLTLTSGDNYTLDTLTGEGTTNIEVAAETVELDLTDKTIKQNLVLTGENSLILTGTLKEGSEVVIDNYLSGNSLEITEDFDPTIVVNNYADSEQTQGVVNIMYKGQINTLTNNGGVVNVVNVDPEQEDNEAYVINDLTVADPSFQEDVVNNNFNIGKVGDESSVAGLAVSSKTISYQNVKVSSGSLTMSITADDTGETNYGSIQNSIVTVEENGTLTANASNITGLLNAETGTEEDAAIINDGTIVFVNDSDTVESVNNNDIVNTDETKGNLVIDGSVTNNASIQQSAVTVASDALFTNSEDATITTNALLGDGELMNNGTLLLNLDSAEGFGIKSITSDAHSGAQQGVTTITANTTGIELDLTGKTIAQDLVELKGTGTVSLTADPEGEAYDLYTELVNYLQTEDGTDGLNLHVYVYPSLDNRGVVNIFEDGVARVIYNSTGTVNLLGGTHYSDIDTDNEEDISLNIVNIGDAEHATDLMLDGSGHIYSQTINISSGSLMMGEGREGGAVIYDSSMTITSNGSLVAWSAGAINTIDNEIRSDGQIIFEGGTNTNDITGNGTLIIDYGWVVNGLTEQQAAQYEEVDSVAATIAQSTVTVNTGLMNSSGTIITNYLIGAEDSQFVNDDKLVLNVKDSGAFDIKTLTGVGVSSITVTDDAADVIKLGIQGVTIRQDRLEFYGDKTLVVDGSATPGTRAFLIPPTIQADIYNYMTGDSLHLTYARQEGDFVNNEDSVAYFGDDFSVGGQIINNGGTLNIVSSGFVVEDGITADQDYQTDISKNILNIGDADDDIASVVNSSTTISYQTINVSSGSLVMNNIVDNAQQDGSITNSSITVEGDGLLTVNPEKLVNITNPITNDGVIEFYGGGEDYVLNVSTISASNEGTLRINGNVQNDEQVGISKQNIEVLQTSTFTVNANDMTDSNIANDGKLIFWGISEMTNDTEVTGEGNLSVSYYLTNNAKIEQTDVQINADTTNNAEITASGTLMNYADLTNTSAIEASIVRNELNATTINESGASITATDKLLNLNDIENKEGAAIQAGELTNEGTIKSSGSITATNINNKAGAVIEIYKTNDSEETYAGGTLSSNNTVINEGIITANADGVDADIKNEGNELGGVYNITGGTVKKDVYGINTETVKLSTVNIQGDVTIKGDAFISQNEINITEDSTLILEEESSLKTSTLDIHNKATLNTQNGKTGEVLVDGVNIDQGITWNWKLDLDLDAVSGDVLTNVTSNGKLTIDDIKILSDQASINDSILIAQGAMIDIERDENDVIGLFSTQDVTYKVKLDTSKTDGTYLSIKNNGYGGLPGAVYDGVLSYSITESNYTDKVTSWIDDHNELIENLFIHGGDGTNKIVVETESGDPLVGIDAGNYRLEIENLAGFEGFENAITIGEKGELRVSTVTFTANTGDAVITNAGTAVLNGVIFEDNDVSADVVNNGKLTLTGENTIFENGITGTGDTVIDGVFADMTSALLVQNKVEVGYSEGSKLTVAVDNLTDGDNTTSLIMNNGELILLGNPLDEPTSTPAALSTNINGVGNTTISGGAVVAGEDVTIAQKTITIDEDASLTAGANQIDTFAANGKITNKGELEFTGGTNNNVIDGEGLLFISGTVANSTGTKISQQFIEVKEDAKFAMNADDVETGTDGDLNGIQNNGDLEITGGTNNNNIGRGDGANGNVIISGNVTNKENIKIEQKAITVNEGANFEANASDLETVNGITSNGGLTFTGGTNENAISGDNGILTIAGTVTNNAIVSQSEINIETGAVLSSTASALTAQNGITNNGTLKFDSGLSDDSNANDISGLGTLIIDNDTIVNNTGMIVQKELSIVTVDSWFATNADKISVANPIQNAGVLEYIGGESNNDIKGEGILYISGDVVNSTGTRIEQNTIQVVDEGSLVANASDLTASIEILNDGDLEFTGGINKNKISQTEDEQGNIIISGAVTNTEGTTVDQNTITVNTGAELTANASDLTTDNGITNKGGLVLTGGTNENAISGESGILTIAGEVTNNAAVSQSEINIETGAVLSSTASALTAQNGITNSGTLKFDSGLADDSNANDISGLGKLVVDGKTAVENTGAVLQKEMEIGEGSSFVTSADNFSVGNAIVNKGLLEYINGTNNNDIKDSGELVISGAVENSLGARINQSTITIREAGRFETFATTVVTGDGGIVNDGALTFTGGVNTSTITMTGTNGTLDITADLENMAEVSQKAITVADNVTVVTEAGKLLDVEDVDQTITLGQDAELNFTDNNEEEDATLTANITGKGFVVKEGAGKVILTGTNNYTGVTTISEGSIEISSADNISENTIYMDGGKLVINTEEADVELGNKIVGTYGTNGIINQVIMEVTGEGTSTLTTTGQIYGNGNLLKYGEGTLDLRMDSNDYTGDTNILNGKLVGTTANIHGTIFGSGDDASAVEFYDAEGDVTLNEISLENYIGTFDKTGAAVMTVTENFKALNANITDGTFIINNDEEMGGSGKTFEVTGDMIVENALLQGYGNTNVGTLVIGAGATFAPGNSTTTWNQSGNLAFEEDGEYDVEFGQFDMDSEGHYNDNTTVSGTTTIGDDAKITLNNLEGKYYVWETIDLINSGTLADGYEYQEDKVVFNDNDARDLRPGYDTRISTRVYTEGNALKIELQRKQSEYSDAIEFERSHNEQEAANAIDAISTGNGGDITNPLDAMEKMYYYQETYDIEGLQAALNDIAGVIHANSTMLTFTNAKIEHVYDKIQERTKCLLPCTKFHDKVWAEYYYNTYQVDKNENSPKFDTSVNGFLVGFDMISAKQWTMGVMAGYGTSELKQAQDKTTMNDINLGFYGGFENEKWLFKGMLLGGYEQYNTDRTIAFMERMAHSEYNGYSAALDLEAGYKISLNKKDSQAKHKMYLKPFLGVTGSYINNEGFEEKNAESLNLKVNDYSNFAAQARAGVGINGKVKKFGWYAKAGVRQFLTEDYNEIESSLLDYQDQTKMKIRSAELDKFSYGGGLGADFALSDAWTIFANGLASFADKSNNYYGNIGLMYKFGCVNNEKKTDEDVEKITAMLNDKMTEEELLKKQLEDKDKELNDAKKREKELQDRIQKYEANIVSEEEAQKMKEKTIKTMRLGEKPTFVFGTDKLNGSGKESLKQVARELESYPEAEVLVEGHTDNVGGDEINQQISEKRASSVATALKKDYGVKNNISAIGKGKTEPIASNDTAEGRAKNRRVEIIITTNE